MKLHALIRAALQGLPPARIRVAYRVGMPITQPYLMRGTSQGGQTPIRVAYRIWTEATYPSFRRAPLPWLLPPVEATPPEVRLITLAP